MAVMFSHVRHIRTVDRTPQKKSGFFLKWEFDFLCSFYLAKGVKIP